MFIFCLSVSRASGPYFKPIIRSVLALILFSFCLTEARAGNKWELKKEGEGIRIYTRSMEGTVVKALRAEFNARGTLAQVAALLMDIDAQKDWVYSTRSASVLKRINQNELIYYSEKNMPWPVTNRDIVMHVKISGSGGSGPMTVEVNAVNDMLPPKKGIVRVASSSVTWKVEQVSAGILNIEYEASLNPGGSVPGWVVNMFLTKGPFETFKKFRQMLENKG